jgi:YHS domain-containing protein
MKVHDEVCGMTIESDQAAATKRFQGVTYYFCSDRCLGKFKDHPGWYVEIIQEQEATADHGSEDHCH